MICLIVIAVGCANRPLRPVEIEADDICAQCKMAISEKRYAAEMADTDGNVIKFDNIDCMVRYAASHGLREKAPAWFVADSDGKQWLDARETLFVKSAAIPGPMGSGVLCTRDQTQANQLAQHFSGQVLHFDDLWSR